MLNDFILSILALPSCSMTMVAVVDFTLIFYVPPSQNWATPRNYEFPLNLYMNNSIWIFQISTLSRLFQLKIWSIIGIKSVPSISSIRNHRAFKALVCVLSCVFMEILWLSTWTSLFPIRIKPSLFTFRFFLRLNVISLFHSVSFSISFNSVTTSLPNSLF